METSELFGSEKVSKILLKLAPPVMLAQLIQALYNIVDSFFVGKDSESGLTALSIIYPIQLLMIALAVGTGVGINTVMAAKLGAGNQKEAEAYAGTGTSLAIGMWLLFAGICYAILPAYARMSTSSPDVIQDVVAYGRIVCVCSFGQIVAAAIVLKKGFRRSPAKSYYPRYIKTIFRLGMPNILMQSAYTFYILGLNLILSSFSDQAVTALGLYYKWQTFFFIPLGAMQTCIVPVISFNYAARFIDRCKKTLSTAIVFGWALMFLGTLCFLLFPEQMLRVFTSDDAVVAIGKIGFLFVGISFLPMVTSLIFPVFFQATGYSLKSSLLTVIRTMVLFVPLGFLFSRFGLNRFWLTFPVTEVLTSLVGLLFYRQFLKNPYVATEKKKEQQMVMQPSHPGVILTIAREHGSSGKQVGKRIAEQLHIPFYYKEMTALAAQESGLDREFISDINKNAPDHLHDIYLSTHVVQQAVVAQNQIIRKIADHGSCVIVGRAADFVLRDYESVIRIFLYAPEAYKISRVMALYGDTKEEAIRNIHRSDEARSAYYHNISGNEWGNRKYYDLLVDTSIGVEQTAKVVLDYIAAKENNKA